jgi:hypothetical protein
MIPYLNINGKSNIEAYKIEDTCIIVKFFGTRNPYKYSYSSAGKENVEKMKELARQGCGLNSFIMRNVKYLYEK